MIESKREDPLLVGGQRSFEKITNMTYYCRGQKKKKKKRKKSVFLDR